MSQVLEGVQKFSLQQGKPVGHLLPVVVPFAVHDVTGSGMLQLALGVHIPRRQQLEDGQSPSAAQVEGTGIYALTKIALRAPIRTNIFYIILFFIIILLGTLHTF
jgi:hypothetical protein